MGNFLSLIFDPGYQGTLPLNIAKTNKKSNGPDTFIRPVLKAIKT
jgi:hypothetical protein